MNNLTLVTFNTFGSTLNPYNLAFRYQAIAAYFDSSSVDVIHFQEVFSYFHLFLLKNFLKSYPFCVYQRSYFGPKGGLVIFSRYTLANTRYLGYSRHYVPYFVERSWVEFLTQRGALITNIHDCNLVLINTHLTAVLDGNWGSNGRYYQELVHEISQLHQIISENAKDKIIITSGDFNIAKGSDLYQDLTALPSLNNVFESDNTPTRHQYFATSGQKTNCIDYIFVFGNSRLYKIKSTNRLFTEMVNLKAQLKGYVSDHIGLQVLLEIE